MQRLISLVFFILLSFTLTAASSLAAEIQEKDLAILLPLDPDSSLSFQNAKGSLFPQTWFDAAVRTFQRTPVKSALADESPFDSWRLVAVRVEPCQPVGRAAFQQLDVMCWPELRLVWQSVQTQKVFSGVTLPIAADDRAFHATYRIDPRLVLDSQGAQNAERNLGTLESMVGSISGYFSLLSENEDEFTRARDQVSQAFIADALALRGSAAVWNDEAFKLNGLRPEMTASSLEKEAFETKLNDFLLKWASPSSLVKLTAFSLPEGRRSKESGQWTFAQFKGDRGEITEEPIILWNFKSNIPFFFGESFLTGTSDRDDDAFYKMGPSDQSKVKDSVILTGADAARLVPIFSDPHASQVPNVSCVSCHRLTPGLPFNLHSLSYFQNRPISVSTRVENDVKRAMKWLETQTKTAP